MHFSRTSSRQPALPCRANGLVDLGYRCHARRDDHRLAGCRDFADQWQVRVLERGDLVAGHAELLKEIHRRRIERRRERDQPERPRALEDRGVPLPGSVGLLVELVERPAAPQAVRIVDEEFAPAQVESHCVGGVRLQFQRMSARLRGGIDDCQSTIERLIVIARHFGDDERLKCPADRTTRDVDCVSHRHLQLFSR